MTGIDNITSLREHGKPVEMFVYPGEHHIKSGPVHKLVIAQRTVDWFRFWLQGYEDPT